MILEELQTSTGEKLNYRIFASDRSELQVNEARNGQYSAYALNNVNLKRVNQWFTKHRSVGRQDGEMYTIKPELREKIDFSVFDLLSEQLSSPSASIFGDFDLVFCANLLFYYKSEYRKLILEKITNSLSKGGFIITGEAEREIMINHNCHEVFPNSSIFQIK